MPDRVAIIGAGAVGCALAGYLARSGVAVTLLARGAALAAIRRHGLTMDGPETGGVFPVRAVEQLPPDAFDCVITALKSQDLPALAPILAERTETVVPVVNGVPFWFPRADAAVDRNGILGRAVPRARILGCASFVMARTLGPGHVYCAGTPKLRLGAVDPAQATEAERIALILRAGGLSVDLLDDPAEAVWGKLIVNAATNPLSVISGATLREMHESPALRSCVGIVAAEMTALGRAARLRIPTEPDASLHALAAAGDHLTSMKQDFDAGRPIEFDAICAAPLAIAAELGVPMPATAALFALTCHLADTRPQGARSRG